MGDKKLFIDRLFDVPWQPLFNTRYGEADARARLVPALQDTVRFEISNVMDYVMSEQKKLSKKPMLDDMFVAAPSFPRMWFEYEVSPQFVQSAVDDPTSPDGLRYVQDPTKGKRWVGWYLQAVDIEPPFDMSTFDGRMRYETRKAALEGAHPDDDPRFGWHVDDDTKWILLAYDWGRHTSKDGRHDYVLGPNFAFGVAVSRTGVIQHHHLAPYFDRENWLDKVPFPKLDLSDSRDAMTKFIPVLFALTFMNCRNVVHEIVKPKRKFSKAHAKKHGRPLTQYRLLKVDINKPVVIRHGADPQASAKKLPLHIVRGHFRIYTEEKPLFGHYVGPVWVPAHLKGSEEAGTLIKDYEVVT